MESLVDFPTSPPPSVVIMMKAVLFRGKNLFQALGIWIVTFQNTV